MNKKRKKRKQKRLPEYPNFNESNYKTFQIKYEKTLSTSAKSLLNSFQNKYLYYAIDDILYSFKFDPSERNNLLSIFYTPIISLQNNFSSNFFDIWIHEIYINQEIKTNKFLTNKYQKSELSNYIMIKFWYQTKQPVKKQESLW